MKNPLRILGLIAFAVISVSVYGFAEEGKVENQINELRSLKEKNPQAFISYAWEGDSASLSRQQGYLSQISEDLKHLGIPAWLDIERMSGILMSK